MKKIAFFFPCIFFLLFVLSVNAASPSYYVKPNDLIIYTYNSVHSSGNSTQSVRESWKYQILTESSTSIEVRKTECTLSTGQTENNCQIKEASTIYQSTLNYSSSIGQFLLPKDSNQLDFTPFNEDLNNTLYITWNLESGMVQIDQLEVKINGITKSNDTLNVEYVYDRNGLLLSFEMVNVNGGNQSYIGLDLDEERSIVRGKIYSPLSVQNWIIILLYTGIVIATIGTFWQNRKKYSRIGIIIAYGILSGAYLMLLISIVLYHANSISEPYIYIPLLCVLGYYLLNSGEKTKTKYYTTTNQDYEAIDNPRTNSSIRKKRYYTKSHEYTGVQSQSDSPQVEESKTTQIQFDMKKEMQKFEEMSFNQTKKATISENINKTIESTYPQMIIIPEEEFTLEDITYLPFDVADALNDEKLAELTLEEQQLYRFGKAFINQTINRQNQSISPLNNSDLENLKESLRQTFPDNKMEIDQGASALELQNSFRIWVIKNSETAIEENILKITLNEKNDGKYSTNNIISLWEWTTDEKFQRILPIFTHGADLMVKLEKGQSLPDITMLQQNIKVSPRSMPIRTLKMIETMIQQVAETNLIMKGSELAEIVAYVLDLPKEELQRDFDYYLKSIPVIWLDSLDLIILQPEILAKSIQSLAIMQMHEHEIRNTQLTPEQWQQFLIQFNIKTQEGVFLLQILAGYHLIEFTKESNLIIHIFS
jgi:hypothetical protein